MIRLLFPLVALLIAGCSYAPANVQTLYTKDCGQTWQLIKTGQAVPRATLACESTTTIPDYPMQGETEFKTQFKNALVTVKVTFDYSITDGIKYISEAKYLGKSNGSSEISGSIGGAYEMAENSVIDKRVREAATTMTREEDLVDFSPGEFEDRLQKKANDELALRGVMINSMTFVVIPDDQTRMAIDMATAMKVYRSKDIEELGMKAAIARAGATKIIVGATDEDRKK